MGKCQTDSLFGQTEENPSGHIIRVAFESGADASFDYLVPDEVWPIRVGQRVQTPFGRKNKLQTGFCVAAEKPYKTTTQQRSYLVFSNLWLSLKVQKLFPRPPCYESIEQRNQ